VHLRSCRCACVFLELGCSVRCNLRLRIYLLYLFLGIHSLLFRCLLLSLLLLPSCILNLGQCPFLSLQNRMYCCFLLLVDRCLFFLFLYFCGCGSCVFLGDFLLVLIVLNLDFLRKIYCFLERCLFLGFVLRKVGRIPLRLDLLLLCLLCLLVLGIPVWLLFFLHLLMFGSGSSIGVRMGVCMFDLLLLLEVCRRCALCFSL